jgi:hypothetical protein
MAKPYESSIHLTDEGPHGRCCGVRRLRVAKRQPVDTDYATFSKYFKDVGLEMEKIHYSLTSKDVDMAKQAEQMGFTAQECATVIIRNRHKRKRPNTLA